MSKLLKVATGAEPPSHEDVLEALSRVLDEAQALEKARRLMLRAGKGEGDD